ncbi:nitroreductase family protein [Pseudomonas sp. BMS12]|uniref:nitroreductase family protein n=1 Tax=Pseudomonas sp. BMS12 TaxID=1796033 RepID=UPI00083B3DEF|nr:nitroreductase family protein [Pseudomonas sp. BMS12]
MHPLLEAIAQRSSLNHFDAEARLDDADIRELIGWASRAPSAFNLQNWRFIAVRSESGKQRLRQLAWDQPKVSEAAVTFILCGVLPDTAQLPARLQSSVNAGFMPAAMPHTWQQAAEQLYSDSPLARRDEAVRSATLAAATLMQAGQALGLGACPMTGFDTEAVASSFGLGADEIPVMLVAMGRARAGNWPQKPRRPLEQILELA